MRRRGATIAVLLTGVVWLMAFASSEPASADTIFPWCRSGGGDVGIGTGACYFSTFDQCRTSLAGFGTCFTNPAYVPTTPANAPTAQRHARRG